MTPNGPGPVSYDAIVDVAGISLLERVLAACSQARTVVVVGCPRPTSRPVRWALERPPRGGPLAGLGAGLDALRPDVERVVVLAADLPYITPADIGRLLSALPGHDAVVFADETGTLQPLVAALMTSWKPPGRHLR